MTIETLFILNPHAGGGRAGRAFQRLEPFLVTGFQDFLVAVTDTPEELATYLDDAAQAGISRIIAVGGDGTNHAVLNALADRADLHLTFGTLPLGTGRDWARMLAIPETSAETVAWLASAQPHPCDLGEVIWTDPRTGQRQRRLFLNIASVGVSGQVAVSVNRARWRTPLTYLSTAAVALLGHRARQVHITCDGQTFYHGPTHLAVVANGQYFARGMWPTPMARIDDGLFNVAVLEGVSQPQLMRILQQVYSGAHVHRSDIHFAVAREVTITSPDQIIDMEFDGESAQGVDLIYRIQPGAINMLLHPSTTNATVYPSQT